MATILAAIGIRPGTISLVTIVSHPCGWLSRELPLLLIDACLPEVHNMSGHHHETRA
jgi:hypothetical protein